MSEFHEHLNSVNKHIQFTMEQEEGYLPFLDILSSHGQDCSIDTSVFRKRTHTDRYLSFSSHQPLAHKRSVVNTLFRRAKALSSDPRNQLEEEAHLRVVLKRNGYPKKFVSRSATGMTVLKMDEDDMDEKPKVTVVSETSLHPRSVRDHEKNAGKSGHQSENEGTQDTEANPCEA